MVRSTSHLSDVPSELLEKFRKMGWTDDEILEGLEDAADFLNTQFFDESRGYMPLRAFFEEGSERSETKNDRDDG